MERVLVTLVQLFLLSIAITSGEATKKCFQCLSSSNTKCNDPFDKTAMELTECTPESVNKIWQVGTKLIDGVFNTFSDGKQPGGNPLEIQWTCMKSETKMASGDIIIVRNCNLPKSDNFDPCAVKNTGDKSLYCSICDGDGCNSAVRLGGVSALFYLLVPCLVALKAIAA